MDNAICTRNYDKIPCDSISLGVGRGEKSHTGAISAAPVKLFVHKKKRIIFFKTTI